MNTYQEVHAFVEGFCDSFCFSRCKYEPDEQGLKDIQKEHHYYNAGRPLGRACFIVLIAGIVVWIIGAVV